MVDCAFIPCRVDHEKSLTEGRKEEQKKKKISSECFSWLSFPLSSPRLGFRNLVRRLNMHRAESELCFRGKMSGEIDGVEWGGGGVWRAVKMITFAAYPHENTF